MIAVRQRLRLACLLSVATLSFGGCAHERGDGPNTGPVASSVAVSVPGRVLRVGDTLRANAEAADSAGKVLLGRKPKWETSDTHVASVSTTGLVLGVAPGTATISAIIDGSRGTVDVDVVRPTAASISIAPDSVSIAATASVDLVTTARDDGGLLVLGAVPSWTSSAPQIATVSPTGHVTGVAVGRAEITATLDGVVGRAIVVVARPSSVVVTSISPMELVPNAVVTIVGSGFSTNRSANTVFVGGVAATVRSATATQIVANVATTGYDCDATRSVAVSVTVNGESGTQPAVLQVAPQYALGVGQTLVLSDPAQARCLEVSPAAGRFVVAVYNTTASLAAVPFTLRGARSVASPFTTLRSQAVPVATNETPIPTRVALASYAPVASLAPNAMARSIAAAVDTLTYKVLPASARTCNDATTAVKARAVYVGRRVLAAEDLDAPLAGTMDDDIRRVAQEFDDVTYPLLEANFGNPLAVDSRLGRDGRVTLLFTRTVNDRPGTLGVTLSCDLLPATVGRASNETEIVYLAVPTVPGPGLGDGRFTGTREAWRRRIRAVAAHETKHLVSYAERLARAAPFEEPWLEEGSALIAEELFARTVRALPTRANTTYRESLLCELIPSGPGCADLPLAFTDHFARLYLTMADPGNITPLTNDLSVDPTAAFYGASWWLTRWAIDQSTSPESSFLRALVAGPQTGIDNLVARAGRPWGDLIGDWWLATAVDDLAGFTPQRVALTEPSWNLRDVFAGAQTSGDPRFARAFPLAPRMLSFGDFTSDVLGGVRGAGATFFELSGPSNARQLLELRGIGGGAAPNGLAIAIVRVP